MRAAPATTGSRDEPVNARASGGETSRPAPTAAVAAEDRAAVVDVTVGTVAVVPPVGAEVGDVTVGVGVDPVDVPPVGSVVGVPVGVPVGVDVLVGCDGDVDEVVGCDGDDECDGVEGCDGLTGSCPPGLGSGLAACALEAVTATAPTAGTVQAATCAPVRRACRRLISTRSIGVSAIGHSGSVTGHPPWVACPDSRGCAPDM
jgi:hypothetical protein